MVTKAGNRGNQDSHGPGYSVINKFGVNLDIDTGSVPEAIWAQGGVFPFLSTGIQMDFKSDSVNDALAGTGAQKLLFTLYDDSNIETTQEFDTDGVTRVELPGVLKLNSRIQVSQAGSGTTNAGKITVVDRATGLVVYQSIEIGEGQTLSTPQMVPAGKKGLVKKIFAEYARAGAAFNNADLRFRLRKSNGTIITKMPTTISPDHPSYEHKYEIGGVELEAGDIVFWECIEVSANDTPILAGFHIEHTDI